MLVADVDLNGGRETVEAITALGGTAEAMVADVADIAEGRAAVEEAVAMFGRLDVLVNNAGIFPFAVALRLSEEQWDRVLDVNLKGAFFLAQAAARLMIAARRGGRIVNIASVAALRPGGNLAHYDASKAGLLALTRALALEFAPHHITVNAILPGEIDTPGTRGNTSELDQQGGVAVMDMHTPEFLARIPLGRLGTPEDVANAVLFLASGAAAYITGASLVVDGGFLLA